MAKIPETQHAVQLVGPDQLVLNKSKKIVRPGPHQILAKVEAVGLCFSDLKLLKQFSAHVRKGPVVEGLDPAVLGEISSYVPNDAPAVPGHEAVVRIAAVGPGVTQYAVGQRYLVQPDFRWLRTARSNAAFGYNFEGALQEYVLMDERIITSPAGESMLLPAGESLSGSAIALAEPWACVEDAYACKERTTLKAGGQMLIVAHAEVSQGRLGNLFRRHGTPKQVTWLSKLPAPDSLGVPLIKAYDIHDLDQAGFDDVLYFGASATTVEKLFVKVAPQGLLNIVLAGDRFGKPVVTSVGRIHYSGIRLLGTTTADPAESMKYIPKTGEIRHGDWIHVIGAAGPMGTMHVIRNICQGIEGVTVFAGDVDEKRLAHLTRIVEPLAKTNRVECVAYDAKEDHRDEEFGYTVLMVPAADMVAAAVKQAAMKGIVNIFAGIRADVTAEIDLDAYIEKRLYFIGTSGSTLDDMKRMLAKVESRRLDTNVSVAAVSGLEGAADGIRAVENRAVSGKILVYPTCKGLGLTELGELAKKHPPVAACLKDGLWTIEAEKKLLELYSQ
jgi:threonine dehydrogenase-like Zn-dependent dehydrogenase